MYLHCLGQSAFINAGITVQKYGGIYSFGNKHRHTVSTVIIFMNQTIIFDLRFEHFPVFFLRSVPVPGSNISGTFSLTGHAGCIFRSGITLSRVFTFQGA